MERRALKTGDNPVVARIADLQAAVPSLTGKIELVYEGEQEGPIKVAKHLIGRAVKEIFESHFPPAHRGKKSAEKEEVATSPYRKIVDWFSQGKKLEIGDDDPAADYFAALNKVPGLKEAAVKFTGGEDPDLLAPTMELILEGLHQSAILAKEELEGQVRFLDMFQTMLSNLGDPKR